MRLHPAGSRKPYVTRVFKARKNANLGIKISVLLWSKWRDSNPRPFGPEALRLVRSRPEMPTVSGFCHELRTQVDKIRCNLVANHGVNAESGQSSSNAHHAIMALFYCNESGKL